MKNNLLKILGILILAYLQIALFSKFSVFSSLPNLIFILAIVLVSKGFFRDGLLVAIFGGILLDLASPGRFGIFTLYLIVVVYLLQFVLLKVIPEQTPFWVFGLFLAIFLVFNLMMFIFFRLSPDWFLAIDAFINASWLLGFYLVFDKIYKPREEIKFI